MKFRSFNSKRVTEEYNNNRFDDSRIQQNLSPDVKIEKSGNLDVLDNVKRNNVHSQMIEKNKINNKK